MSIEKKKSSPGGGGGVPRIFIIHQNILVWSQPVLRLPIILNWKQG